MGAPFDHLLTQPVRAEILQARVDRFDQGNFSLSRPALELLLPRDCLVGMVEFFNVDEAVNPVLAGEAWQQPVLMLVHPAGNIVGHPDVKFAGTTCHYIDVEFLFSH
jgi:hypothetical protein